MVGPKKVGTLLFRGLYTPIVVGDRIGRESMFSVSVFP